MTFLLLFQNRRVGGLSSPVVNVLWALFNLVVGYVLFKVSQVAFDRTLSLVPFFAGFAGISIMSAKGFSHKEKN
ncbi:hypothetical protein [Mucilaginibacter paludis]|uniref:hypothetical protein n=1 Tax=Mucilaginibacter paludis TaxID=423351 RepID=UPI0002555B23|nr:hypothetical protein [Mucilaginibacter paludis]